MKTSRQTYIDSNRDEAAFHGADSFQLKYDGWWTQCIASNGNFVMNSKEVRTFRNGQFSSGISAVIIGEFMQGTQWSQKPEHAGKFYIFDLWGLHDVDTTDFPYRDRYALLQTLIPDLPGWCQLVKNYPMTQWDTIWNSQVETGLFEGCVFRNRHDPVSAPIHRIKRDIEATYTITGFVEGIGKYSGTLGAVIIDKKTDSGADATVGGGWSDEERDEIWNNQTSFLGRQFDAVGKYRFESGLLRHPNFKRWK